MKNLRNLMMGVVLAATLMIGTGTANAGVLLSELNGNEPQPCTENQKDDKTDWGIVITQFTGIVITQFTGIVITNVATTPVNCGILMSD